MGCGCASSRLQWPFDVEFYSPYLQPSTELRWARTSLSFSPSRWKDPSGGWLRLWRHVGCVSGWSVECSISILAAFAQTGPDDARRASIFRWWHGVAWLEREIWEGNPADDTAYGRAGCERVYREVSIFTVLRGSWGWLLLFPSPRGRFSADWLALRPRGCRFTFNSYCYKAWSTLVVTGSSTFLYSKKGVTQGDPLPLAFYATSVLPLIFVHWKTLRVGSKPGTPMPWPAVGVSCIACWDGSSVWWTLALIWLLSRAFEELCCCWRDWFSWGQRSLWSSRGKGGDFSQASWRTHWLEQRPSYTWMKKLRS